MINILSLKYNFCNFNGTGGMAELYYHHKIQACIDKKTLPKTSCLLNCMLHTSAMIRKIRNCEDTLCITRNSEPWKNRLRRYTCYCLTVFYRHCKECNKWSLCMSSILAGMTRILCHWRKKKMRIHIWRMWCSKFFTRWNIRYKCQRRNR